ncbi:MAG TPA: 3-dehydro-L-gulonate 2-dehydrogenase [Bryobacteraceae bacterium]|nr:3-dehydro-L-gulonate 2-dehydrogenase [Bryobacteraceae bacterium]
MLRVRYEELESTVAAALRALGFEAERAQLCARLFAETTRDGVYTHGMNRFPRFVRMIRAGRIDIHAVPELVAGHGAVERWDGKHGIGNGNAWHCMQRALALAARHGVGAVALANTTHWMRAGSYGWQAAEAGFIGICWTNTLPNMPPWGSSQIRLGNNPIVFAVPRPPAHIVFDMAMSQFSYGALGAYRERGERLPVDGGFDSEGRLTRDPAAIEQSQRVLPVGYWKGAGLALMLDLIAAILSGGLATHQIPVEPEREVGVSQFFLAIDPAALGARSAAIDMANRIVDAAGSHYPGQKAFELRAANLTLGVPVEDDVWREVCALAG